MSKGAKSGGRDFEKGNPGGPGTPPLPEEIRKMATLTKKEALAILGEYLQKPYHQLEAILEDKSRRAFDHVTAAIITKAVEGDSRYLREMLDRLYGKVTDKIELSLPKPTIIVRPSGEQVLLGAEERKDE